MTQAEIAEKIVPYLVEEFEIDGSLVTPDANLRETLQLDSLDYVDLVVVIESSFKFKVRPGDFQDIVTFSDFYAYVERRLNEPEPQPEVVAENTNPENA